MTTWYKVCWYYKGYLKEEGHLEDQDVDGRIILIYYPAINLKRLDGLIWMSKGAMKWFLKVWGIS
jgi:hypothetical protein